MTSLSTAESPLNITLPSGWSSAAMALLEPDEQVLAWLEPDLDEKLYFATGVIVLTSRRLLSRAPNEQDWLTWNIAVTHSLQNRDHAGVGAIELFNEGQRLAVWRHTLGMAPAVSRLIDSFSFVQQKLEDPDAVVAVDAASCPTCGTPYAPDQDECAVCDEDPVGPGPTGSSSHTAHSS